jgi:transglutaminase-like putative cysteine protease
MSFGRQKRFLLGWLALLAPLPLPFNDIVGWPSIVLYALGVGAFLYRARLDPPRWIPVWLMNLLGILYIPIFIVDLRSLSHGLVGPVIHLGLFAILVKLFALVRERDKWQTMIGVFFIFLAAMGTSVHPTIVLYLAAFLALSLLVLTRFALFHVLVGCGREEPALAAVPLRGFLGFTSLAGVVVAVPFFLFLPRVKAPFVVGRAGSMGSESESVGFSDQVSLDALGRIRGDRGIALRLLQEGPTPMPDELRLKAATYDVYLGGSWRRSPIRGPLQRRPGVRFVLREERPARWATLWLQPLRSQSVPLPVETVLIEPRASTLLSDEGGAIYFPIRPLEVAQYRVGLVDRPVLTGSVPLAREESALDLTGVTPRVAALAAQVMGVGAASERALRLERHLMSSYTYTLDFVGRESATPIEDFLFRYRSGHCEFFASAMVLMLRSQGIPARLVTGFLGGEYNPFEGYTMVRNENAHAWVEAYLPDRGWQVFDPTPPSGRPEAGAEGPLRYVQQAWDFLQFRWDRYVLTFGLYDQLRIFGGLRSFWRDFWSAFHRGPHAVPPPTAAEAPVTPAATHPGAAFAGWESEELLAVGGALLLAAALLALALWRWRRAPLTASTAYRRLRRRLDQTSRFGAKGRAAPPLGAAAAPLTVQRFAAQRFPAVARPTARVIDFYLRESFGGEELAAAERAALAEALAEAEKGMRKAG